MISFNYPMISFSSWYPDPHPNIKIVRIAIPYQNSEMIQIQLKLIRIRKSGTWKPKRIETLMKVGTYSPDKAFR